METVIFYLLISQKCINSKKTLWNKSYLLCLGNISKDFTVNNKKKPDEMVTCTIFMLIHGPMIWTG